MNVLYVTQYFSTEPTHASTITTYEIVRRLAKRGHTVTVVSADSPGVAMIYEKKARGPRVIDVLPVPSFNTRWYDGFAVLFTHTLAHVPLIVSCLVLNQFYIKFDAIISMYHPTHLATLSALLLSRILKLPLVVKIHDFIVGTLEPHTPTRIYHTVLGKINLPVLKRTAAVLAQSPELRDDIKKECELDGERIIIFPNGVDTDFFKPGIECDELRRKLGLENKTVVLFLGGLYWQRHPDLLIKALPHILHETKDLMTLFVGDGPERPKLVSFAKDLGVSDFVKFVGRVRHSLVAEFISLADVAVGPLHEPSYPAIYGSTPLTVLEYMACEKPVIVCRGGVSGSLVIDGFNGVLVKRGDIDALSLAILDLIRNKTFRESIAHNARKYVEKIYSWDVLMTKLEKVLDSVINAVS